MSDDSTPFSVSADFSAAIRAFDKFTAANNSLTAASTKAERVIVDFAKGYNRTVAQFSAGTAKLKQEHERYNTIVGQSNAIISRYGINLTTTEQNLTRVIRAKGAYIAQVKEEIATMSKLDAAQNEAERVRLANSSSFGAVGRGWKEKKLRDMRAEELRQVKLEEQKRVLANLTDEVRREYATKMKAERQFNAIALRGRLKMEQENALAISQLRGRLAQEQIALENSVNAQNAAKASAFGIGAEGVRANRLNRAEVMARNIADQAALEGRVNAQNAAKASAFGIGAEALRQQRIQKAQTLVNVMRGQGTAADMDSVADRMPTREGGNWLTDTLKHTSKIFLVYRTLGYVKDRFLDAAAGAKELSRQISEIRTITQQSGMTFNQFRDQILGVSNAFGIAAEDVAEGTYQAISNQVVDAGHSMLFMHEAAKFALVTQAKLSESVNVLSSALNSYNLSASQTQEVSAILFKTIELGRLRAGDIANSFGNVAVIAGQLGAPMVEVGAALAAMTKNGVTAANAMTYLRGLLQKLMEPTEEMEALLKEWGFASGQAAIETLGLSGFLAKLTVEVDGSSDRVGELFTNIRAIQAAMSLAGNKTSSFTDDLADFGTRLRDTSGAITEMTEKSLAVKLDKELQKLRNHFVSLFLDFSNGIAKMTEGWGGFRAILNGAVGAMTGIVVKMAVFRAATVGAAVDATRLGWSMTSLTHAVRTTNIAVTALRANLISFGIGLAVTWALELKRQAEDAKEALSQLITEGLSKMTEVVNARTSPAIEALDKKYKALMVTLAKSKADMQPAINGMEAYATATRNSAVTAIDLWLDAQKKLLSEAKKNASELQSMIEESERKTRDIDTTRRDKEAQDRIDKVPEDQKINQLVVERRKAEQEAKDYASAGTKDGAERARHAAAQALKFAEQEAELRKKTPGMQPIKDKGVYQESLERQASKKAAEIAKLDERIANAPQNLVDPAPLIAEQEAKRKELAELQDKINIMEDRRQGKSVRDEQIVTSAERFQGDIEQTIQASAKAQIEKSDAIITPLEATITATETVMKSFKEVLTGTVDTVGKLNIQLGLLEKLGAPADVLEAGKKAVKTEETLAEAKARDELLSKAQREAQGKSAASKAAIQGLTELIVADQQKKAEIAQTVLDFPVPTRDYGHPLKGYTGTLGELVDTPTQKRMYKLVEDSKAMAANAARAKERGDLDINTQFNYTPEDMKFIQETMQSAKDGVIPGLSSDQSAAFIRIGRKAGYKLPGEEEAAKAKAKADADLQAYDLKPTTPTQAALIKFTEATQGKNKQPFTEEEFELIKNSSEKVKATIEANGVTLETLNSLGDTAEMIVPKFTDAAQAMVDEMLAAAERLKSIGVDMLAAPAKKGVGKEKNTDADAVNGTAPQGTDSKAHGGFTLTGGQMHPREFVVNRMATDKYRSVLEKINSGDENFFLGQQGGRHGAEYARRGFMTKFFSGTSVRGVPLFYKNLLESELFAGSGFDPFLGTTRQRTPFVGMGGVPFQTESDILSSEASSLLSGLLGRAGEYNSKFGQVFDVDQLRNTLSGKAYDQPANKQAAFSTNFNFGNFDFRTSNDNFSVDGIMGAIIPEIRRRISRQMGVI